MSSFEKALSLCPAAGRGRHLCSCNNTLVAVKQPSYTDKVNRVKSTLSSLEERSAIKEDRFTGGSAQSGECMGFRGGEKKKKASPFRSFLQQQQRFQISSSVTAECLRRDVGPSKRLEKPANCSTGVTSASPNACKWSSATRRRRTAKTDRRPLLRGDITGSIVDGHRTWQSCTNWCWILGDQGRASRNQLAGVNLG